MAAQATIQTFQQTIFFVIYYDRSQIINKSYFLRYFFFRFRIDQSDVASIFWHNSFFHYETLV